MHPEILRHLRCPACASALSEAGASLRCPFGHTFDRARQGYVSLLGPGAKPGGDTAPMVEARSRFLAAGHYAPLVTALWAIIERHLPSAGLLIEVGAGTAYYLAAVLERAPERVGLALDLSRYAARRAARAHPRLAAVVADATRPLPLADGGVALILDLFAPRNAPELRRLLRPDGFLIVVTPTAEHLAELREGLGLLAVDPAKERRLDETLGSRFRPLERSRCRFALQLPREDAARAAAMGPLGHHVDATEIALRAARLPPVIAAWASVRIDLFAPA